MSSKLLCVRVCACTGLHALYSSLAAIRPFCKDPKPVTTLEMVNTAVQMVFNVALFYTFGGKALVYLLLGTLFGFGFHPCAGHFISEHYLYNKGQATHSYYGELWVGRWGDPRGEER